MISIVEIHDKAFTRKQENEKMQPGRNILKYAKDFLHLKKSHSTYQSYSIWTLRSKTTVVPQARTHRQNTELPTKYHPSI